jgi:hypothetical protein
VPVGFAVAPLELCCRVNNSNKDPLTGNDLNCLNVLDKFLSQVGAVRDGYNEPTARHT